MDSHNSRVPEPVWELLRYVLPRAKNVRGVVFELLEQHAQRLGADLIIEEAARAREIWHACRPSEATP